MAAGHTDNVRQWRAANPRRDIPCIRCGKVFTTRAQRPLCPRCRPLWAVEDQAAIDAALIGPESSDGRCLVCGEDAKLRDDRVCYPCAQRRLTRLWRAAKRAKAESLSRTRAEADKVRDNQLTTADWRR